MICKFRVQFCTVHILKWWNFYSCHKVYVYNQYTDVVGGKYSLISLKFCSPPIFKFKVSMDSSHQARLNGVVLLKINGAVHEIFMKNHFVRNTFSLISQERLHQISSLMCLWICVIKPDWMVLSFWKLMEPFTRY